jgi:PPM family protein phosphatase
VVESGSSVITLPTGAAAMSYSARTDVGAVRSVNEDSMRVAPPIFLVADGMGGHARGDVASQTVVRIFTEHIAEDALSTPERILDAIHSSNDAVRALTGEGERGTAVSGTTLAGIALVDAGEGDGVHWMAYNVGDSRIYMWDGRDLTQLSVDHSAVQELVDAGLIAVTDAERHPDRNVITRAIGAEDYVDADVWLVPARGRQTFVICSDGISKELGDDAIASILAGEAADGSGNTLADALVDAAIAKGGRDNVTAVVVHSEVDASPEFSDSTSDRPIEHPLEDTTPRS